MEAIIILAGGSGTRLWPASTKERPKQFLTLGLENSFLQNTVERSLAVKPEAEIVIVTHKDYTDATAEQLAGFAEAGARLTILPEPEGRNTAPAILFAGIYLSKKLPPQARVLILSSDHLISPTSAFVADVKKAAELGASGFISVFGIPPLNANTGYGYIEAGAAEGPGYRAAAFREKPDRATAESYLAAGNYYWNSGMFLFSLETLFEEFTLHAPGILRPFETLSDSQAYGRVEERLIGKVRVWGEGELISGLYESIPSISVDYAILEKSAKTAMVKAGFSWNDVGSWDEVARLLPGECPALFSAEAGNNAVYSDIPVALCGVQDLVVVIRNGKALIMKKGSSQLVRDAANAL